MSVTTAGFEVSARSRWLREGVELLSSMRFAISLLTLICIASVIGTVVKQHEPFNNYVNQFGPFWADVFAAVGLYTVYSAWWFLLILAFLVVSTSLCIARNTPKIIADLKAYKEHLREQSLQAFHHKAQGTVDEPRAAAYDRIAATLGAAGWRAKVQVRPHGTMIAARKGASNKLGYLAAHGAIVLICLGGLFDGDLVVRAQMWLQDKSVYRGGGLISEVPPQHRLGPNNPTYRANLLVPEGARAGTAILSMPDGVVLQDLPFDVELKKFIVEYYETGMPKLFASEIVIHDHETGQSREARVEVNHPAFHRGVAIYQSSFDDGGSSLKLRAIPLHAGAREFEVQGVVGSSTTLQRGGETLQLEFTGLRVINVENFGAGGMGSGTDVRRVDLKSALDDHLGSGAKVRTQKQLRNVGPSVTYKLRDASGQAREFHNYMLPIELDGQRVMLAGVRENPNESFRYLRIPVDADDSIDTWVRLRTALDDPALRDLAARRYAAAATPADRPEMAEQLRVTSLRLLTLFAGQEPADQPHAATPAADTPPVRGGLASVARFLESTVPEGERERVSEVLLRILSGSLFELLNTARAQAGQPALVPDAQVQDFLSRALTSLSDSFFYPAPVLLQLTDFQQVQASVFQVARAPGKNLVYLGAVLLIVGVFVMLYVRERRLWVWLEDDAGAPGARTRIVAALSTTRRTLEADAEFDRLKTVLVPAATAPAKESA
ncbi:cytochrome c biogenesis protein ResB [Calidifontimicrobium sp. SYSU G02091]|uniref:cytochrome c biogenesis protein ResB n=1 Tax=Calidifontimicrobium sp. SYSU G02091 TaxID=2926421 RepID=UPI001F5338F2|nr:cytochrome c biogenesis protein ResB [Calidifontimicrobium sp. SYSU G02091]MCI1192507.1 cytochrome c biogenesis protein ResB [Calidifontimicrobium sp. SYSU G02091]